MPDPIMWAMVVVAAVAAEAMTLSFSSTWFAIGGMAALVVSLLEDNPRVQFGVFLIVSLLSLLFIRPMLLHAYSEATAQPTNANTLLGRQCVVVEPVSNLRCTGQIRVDGNVWSAKSEGGDIPLGAIAVISKIEGVHTYIAWDGSSFANRPAPEDNKHQEEQNNV